MNFRSLQNELLPLCSSESGVFGFADGASTRCFAPISARELYALFEPMTDKIFLPAIAATSSRFVSAIFSSSFIKRVPARLLLFKKFLLQSKSPLRDSHL
jgi:hypothetical protein